MYAQSTMKYIPTKRDDQENMDHLETESLIYQNTMTEMYGILMLSRRIAKIDRKLTIRFQAVFILFIFFCNTNSSISSKCQNRSKGFSIIITYFHNRYLLSMICFPPCDYNSISVRIYLHFR
jgi:hypothetical protein